LKCIQAVVDRELRASQAAERLGRSSRQVRRAGAAIGGPARRAAKDARLSARVSE